jgi:predicted signal transduction protein with EAL and GGDEF domain
VLQLAAAGISCLPAQAGIPVSVSCGIASFTGGEFAHALTLAEVACRTARDRGPGRIETYTDTDSSMARRYADTMTLGRLRDALQNDRLTLYAQKIAPLKPHRAHAGYELLLRAIDDVDTRRAPTWLFSAAQRYQMEPDVDRWVIEHALEEASGFRAALADSRVSLSINVSSSSLIDWELVERVRSLIRRSRLAPELLIFEITETAAVDSVPAAPSGRKKTCAARGGKRVAAHKSKRTPGKLFAGPRRRFAEDGACNDVGASGMPTINSVQNQ